MSYLNFNIWEIKLVNIKVISFSGAGTFISYYLGVYKGLRKIIPNYKNLKFLFHKKFKFLLFKKNQKHLKFNLNQPKLLLKLIILIKI